MAITQSTPRPRFESSTFCLQTHQIPTSFAARCSQQSWLIILDMKHYLMFGVNPFSPERLYLPSCYLAITSNLAAALRHMRHPDRPRRMWVDAVCISQQDDNEKGHQVALMSQVYSNTERCLAWVGEGTEESYTAISQLKDIVKSAGLAGIDCDNPEISILDLAFTRTKLDAKAKQALRDFVADLNLPIIGKFFGREWFDRLWVFQEFALPREVELWSGLQTISIHDISVSMAFFLVISMGGIFDITGTKIDDAVILLAGRQRYHQASRRIENSFWLTLDVINTFSMRKCSNDMDRIYGLLGLATTDNESFADIRYGSTVEEVYVDFAKMHLERQDISVLHYTARWLSKDDLLDDNQIQEWRRFYKLPTWVPDWRLDSWGNRNNADGFMSATSLNVSISTRDAHLPFISIAGTIVDIVAQNAVNFLPRWEGMLENPLDIIKLKDLFLGACLQRRYPTGEDAEDVFIRTIVSDLRTTNTRITLADTKDPLHIQTMWAAFENRCRKCGNTADSDSTNIEKTPYEEIAANNCRGRTFLVTESGYIGLGRSNTRPGDVVVVFDGAETPFILRRVPTDEIWTLPSKPNGNERFVPEETWEVIGDCYIHGFMDGEATAPEYRAKRQTFWLT